MEKRYEEGTSAETTPGNKHLYGLDHRGRRVISGKERQAMAEWKVEHPLPEARRIISKKRHVQDAEHLAALADAYFYYADQNPIVVEQSVGGAIVEVKKPRAYSWQGLAAFCGFTTHGMLHWRNPNHQNCRPELHHVMAMIDDVINSQTYEYGQVGVFSPSLTARVLGLREQVENYNQYSPPVEAKPNDQNIADLVHPDDPDPVNSGLRFSAAQLAAGMKFPGNV